MNHEKLKNQSETNELLNSDDEKLRHLLGNLKRVDAPKDFDFKLKARIANRQSQNFRQPFLTPVLRYVLPSSLVVLLAALVTFNMMFSSTENQSVTTVADNFQPAQNTIQTASPEQISKPLINEAEIASVNPVTDATAVVREKTVAQAAVLPKQKVKVDKQPVILVKDISGNKSLKTNKDSGEEFGGTVQPAQKESRSLYPRGLNPNSANADMDNFEQKKLSLREILSGIGIEADWAGNNWKILTIKENSPAMRSGLKMGDFIETIDDKKLTSDTVFLQAFTGRIFRVLRDGKPMTIELSAK